MDATTLLADPAAIHLECFVSETNSITLVIHSIQQFPCCPKCSSHSKLYGEMQGRGLSPRIVRYTHAILSSALKKAVELDILPRNVAKLVQLPKQTRREMDVLNKEEARKFLDTLNGKRHSVMFAFALEAVLKSPLVRSLGYMFSLI